MSILSTDTNISHSHFPQGIVPLVFNVAKDIMKLQYPSTTWVTYHIWQWDFLSAGWEVGTVSHCHWAVYTVITSLTFLRAPFYCIVAWVELFVRLKTQAFEGNRDSQIIRGSKGKFYTDSIYNGECNAGITGPLVFFRKTICDAKPTCCGWTFGLKSMFWSWPLCSCSFERKCTSPFCSYSILVARRATLLV